jgi:hypothetical protein
MTAIRKGTKDELSAKTWYGMPAYAKAGGLYNGRQRIGAPCPATPRR